MAPEYKYPVEDYAHEALARRSAKRELHKYIQFTSPNYKVSAFSEMVCDACDRFLDRMRSGKRPVLILQAPPQHGKSEIVSRKLPAFVMGRDPSLRIAGASYAEKLATTMGQSVRRNLASAEHQKLFNHSITRGRYDTNRIGEFTAPGGSGSYIGVGVGAGLTGLPVDLGIIDDPTKDQQEALSPVTKESHWSWYQSVFTTRLSENSGQIIMATSWAEDDLPARVAKHFLDNDPTRLMYLRFPAINLPGETGYDPDLPQGALCPNLHSIEKLRETKALMSDYWWSALYQQRPKPVGGTVFKDEFIQYYLPKQLPARFDRIIISVDATFKDTDGTDFVSVQVWGKFGANCYLLAQTLKRMGFRDTLTAILAMRDRFSMCQEVLIEDKANGPAIIDMLKGSIPGVIPIEPDGSKLARAHAMTWVWEARNIFLPHPDVSPWIKHFTGELTSFPNAAHDDQVDALTQAVRHLYPLFEKLNINPEALRLAAMMVRQ